jgi:hypothetical protein
MTLTKDNDSIVAVVDAHIEAAEVVKKRLRTRWIQAEVRAA